MFVNSFIGSQIRALLHELSILSGKQFRDECFLFPDEEFGAEKRISLGEFLRTKMFVVNPLQELSSIMRNIEQALLYNHQIASGYEDVAEKYYEILMQRWILVVDKYKKGYDPDPSFDFKMWAYGLIEVDQIMIEDFRKILNATEKMLKEKYMVPKDFGEPFRLDYITNDLINAGLPINGLWLSRKDDSDLNQEEINRGFYKLQDGGYIGLSLLPNAKITSKEKKIVYQMLVKYEQEMNFQIQVCKDVRLELARNGHKILDLRFNRDDTELTFDPEKFLAIDTKIGVLEIRFHKPITFKQRDDIKRIVGHKLGISNIETFPPSDLALRNVPTAKNRETSSTNIVINGDISGTFIVGDNNKSQNVKNQD